MDLSHSYPTIKQTDCCNALQLTPAAGPELLSYSLNIANRTSCGKGLYFRNLANDFEAHCFDTVSRSFAARERPNSAAAPIAPKRWLDAC